jgi:ketopantoate reductase
MTGAIVELAEKLDLAVPYMQTLHACIDLADRVHLQAARA